MSLNLTELSNTSVAICRYKEYRKLAQRIRYIYHNSQIYRRLNKFQEKTNVCFRYSFLGRIVKRDQANFEVLDNSRIIQYLANTYKRCKDKIIHHSKVSATLEVVKDTKEQLKVAPARIGGTILISMLLVNITLSFVLDKQIGAWGWLARSYFLFVAMASLFCKADWSVLKENSVLLRKIRKK